MHLWMAVANAGFNVLNLHSPSWPLTLIAVAPLKLASSVAMGAVLVSVLCPQCPSTAHWAYTFGGFIPSSVLTGLGMPKLAGLSVVVAQLVWLAVFSPKAGNVKLGMVCFIYGGVLQKGLLACAENLATVKILMPQILHGMIMPLAVMAYEGFSILFVPWGWQRFYKSRVPLQLFNVPAVAVVQVGEAVRLVGFMTASLHSEWSEALRELAVGVGLSVIFDVTYRSMIVEKLFLSAIGKDHEVSPEYDVFLRCRFEYGYTPIIYIASTVLVVGLHGAEWAVKPMLWVSMAAGLIGELVTDATFVLLHWWTARRVESPRQTLQRLMTPGGHRVLFMNQVSQVLSFEDSEDAGTAGSEDAGTAGADEDEGSPDAERLDVGCISLPLRMLFQLLIAQVAARTTRAALYGNFGSCTDWFSGQLCS